MARSCSLRWHWIRQLRGRFSETSSPPSPTPRLSRVRTGDGIQSSSSAPTVATGAFRPEETKIPIHFSLAAKELSASPQSSVFRGPRSLEVGASSEGKDALAELKKEARRRRASKTEEKRQEERASAAELAWPRRISPRRLACRPEMHLPLSRHSPSLTLASRAQISRALWGVTAAVAVVVVSAAAAATTAVADGRRRRLCSIRQKRTLRDPHSSRKAGVHRRTRLRTRPRTRRLPVQFRKSQTTCEGRRIDIFYFPIG